MICALMTAGAVMAQPSGRGRQGQPQKMDSAMFVQRQTERMVSTYGLDEKQAAQLLELNSAYAGKLFGQRNHGGRPEGMQRGPRPQGGDNGQAAQGQKRGRSRVQGEQNRERPQMTEEQREKMRQEMQERRAQREKDQAAYNEALEKIMTKKQYKAYQDDIQKRQEAMQARMSQGRGNFGTGQGNWN